MKIEIVEFYPIFKKNNDIKGTMHIYIIDYELDIRGIFVTKQKKHWWFEMPYRSQYEKETKKEVRFPVICFTNQEKNDEFFKLLIENGKEYINKNFLKDEELDKKVKQV